MWKVDDETTLRVLRWSRSRYAPVGSKPAGPARACLSRRHLPHFPGEHVGAHFEYLPRCAHARWQREATANLSTQWLGAKQRRKDFYPGECRAEHTRTERSFDCVARCLGHGCGCVDVL